MDPLLAWASLCIIAVFIKLVNLLSISLYCLVLSFFFCVLQPFHHSLICLVTFHSLHCRIKLSMTLAIVVYDNLDLFVCFTVHCDYIFVLELSSSQLWPWVWPRLSLNSLKRDQTVLKRFKLCVDFLRFPYSHHTPLPQHPQPSLRMLWHSFPKGWKLDSTGVCNFMIGRRFTIHRWSI